MTAVWEHGPGDLRAVVDDLGFPEGPRWHKGALWFSDMDERRVARIEPAATAAATGPGAASATTVVEVPQHPSGLGWLPDGRLLVVSMHDRRLLRQEDDGSLVEAADLSAFAPHHCNDMVVDAGGRAYVGHFGFDPDREDRKPATLLRVDPDGSVSVVAGGLEFPNGTVITADGGTMIVAESYAHRLTAFDVDGAGDLRRHRTWADLGGAAPDGTSGDAEGGVWVASPVTKEVIRVLEGGAVVGRVAMGTRRPLACMLGGADRRTLFICSVGRREEAERGRTGRIDAIDVEVAGSGLP